MAVAGWRVWALEDGCLSSPCMRNEWIDGRLSATCLCCDSCPCFGGCRGCAPYSEPCHCGIFLLESPGAAVERSGSLDSVPSELFVLGMARGWGRTVHHEHGWRVEHAQAVGFVTKPDGVLAETAAELLGVPLYSFAEAVRLAEGVS
jgi:hypothetical protein